MDEDERSPIWRSALAVLLVVMALSFAGMLMLGGQVSKVLSTVGASVSTPQGYVENPGPNGGPEQNGGDSGGGDSGSGDDGADGDDSDDGGSSGLIAFQDVTRPDLLIIRRGSIAIQVADIDAAVADAGGAIASLGGYESGSTRTGRGEDARAEVVYRFPASSWQAALVAIRDVGDEVLDEQSETTDVSAEVVDIEARIRNLQVTEAAMQSIMDRATVIKDVLSVQAELTRVRSEIEQLSSKAASLREQAAMSTLSVAFVLPETPAIARQEAGFNPGREAEAATARLVSILQALAVAGIWLAIVWLPVLVALAIAAGIAFLVIRRVRGRSDAGGAPLATSGDAA
jgi:hypothetical protein